MRLMCCFSRPVREVASTRIFARPLEGDRQLLVYAMSIDAPEDLAMVLPIPVPVGSAEDAVRFVDLSACPRFFEDVGTLFPSPATAGFGPAPQARSLGAAPKLVVHDVGDFEASFVPHPRDFGRLDERFRLPPGVFEKLPQYADWGFCVFKLKSNAVVTVKETGGVFGLFTKKETVIASNGPRTIHPMAFEFSRRDASTLFFPTVHVHDGVVHDTALFDHVLYFQVTPSWGGHGAPADWFKSWKTAGDLPERTRPWFDLGAHVFTRTMRGTLPNEDTILQG